jgi:predicted transcriptional regulator
MINTRRSDIDILIEILKISSEKTKKTWILHRANMSHNQLEKYLGLLIEKQLLVKHNEPYAAFETSDRGHEFIDLAEKMSSFFD